MSDLVTGEAVVLELRLARPATRALAFFIDILLQLVCFGILMILVALVTGDGASGSLIGGLVIACLVLTFVGYNTTIETLTRGKSIGKYAMGLRVVRDDGGPVGFRQALVRALCGVFVDFFLTSGCVGFFTAMLSPRGKRVGDILAGTVVLRERAPKAADPIPDVPPALLPWASRAEMSRLPDDLALSVRSYLSRYHELSPEARTALGNQLAGAVVTYVSPPPPAGVPAWAYLAAVLGERRKRAFAQLHQTAPAGQWSGGGSMQASGDVRAQGLGQGVGQGLGPGAGQGLGPGAGQGFGMGSGSASTHAHSPLESASQAADPTPHSDAPTEPAPPQSSPPQSSPPPSSGGFAPPR
ncbi:RDD family protein [Actinopolymorpha alba]|uniref:RDD family protein n=1 Tax=Actinopolymorpha alba TaxID=533267 RepID=UPI0003673F76|nr:RDD family protein [Actinopolymorpha alba]